MGLASILCGVLHVVDEISCLQDYRRRHCIKITWTDSITVYSELATRTSVLLKKIVSGWFRLRTQNLLKIVVHVIFAIVYSAVHFYSSVYASTCTKVSRWSSSIVLLFQTRCYKLIKKILIRPNNLYESLSFKMGDSRSANAEALSSELIFYVNGKKVTK